MNIARWMRLYFGPFHLRGLQRPTAVAVAALLAWPASAWAAEGQQIFSEGRLNPRALLQAGGPVGYVIIFLSLATVALVVEHLLSIRRGSLMPKGLVDELQRLIPSRQYTQAIEQCQGSSSFLGFIVAAGLQEIPLGYGAVEKAMEDASVEQTARLMRKIDYLSLIGAVAPMLGLLGTVWGMIQAFAEFAEKANPLPADFAPSISQALVTTLFGLLVAIPASAAYVWFRNRIDEFVAESALLATHLTSPLKRALAERRRGREQRPGGTSPGASGAENAPKSPRPQVPPVAIERGPQQ